jgi:5-histidylcysteine sulfoxide synthase/putative 4-mercaptohistidine N1-methyltranferase
MSTTDRMNIRRPLWWTGRHPLPGACPGVDSIGRIHALSSPNLQDLSRQVLLDYFDNAWTLTEVLFSALRNDDAFYRQPSHRLRHPLIFYYGHPAVLYVNKLRLAGLVSTPLHSEFERLFEVGVDEMSWDDLSEEKSDWPTVEAVTQYRARVYALVRGIIESSPDLDRPPTLPRSGSAWAVLLAVEHERIHFETSSVLIRELPEGLVAVPPEWPAYPPLARESLGTPLAGVSFPANSLVDVPPAEVRIGKPAGYPTFGWDNEYGFRSIAVPRFRASRLLTSNGEYWLFVASGGYSEHRYWSTEGWQWRTFRNARWPTFWVPDGPEGFHHYRLRLCFETVPIQWSWPVIVNFHEAKAFCAWKSEHEPDCAPYRFLTEAEHHRLRDFAVDKSNRSLACGSEGPVDASSSSADAFCDIFGNAWQWCEDHFAPLPGFTIDPLYEDFSIPCFDGKHNLIMGGSFASTGGETSLWARFHFRPHFFQHAGFRLVQPAGATDTPETTCQNAPPPHAGTSPCCLRKPRARECDRYESRDVLNQYLLLHFGNRDEISRHRLPSESCLDFPRRCATLLREAAQQYDVPVERALDLGCAVGGAAFELARDFRDVQGIDLSAQFIATANVLRERGQVDYAVREEGDLLSPLVAVVDPDIDRTRVRFEIGDACALPQGPGPFNVVLMANLLCRLPDPKACLARLGGLVAPGGLVLITSPYSWLTDYTPRSAWLGGRDPAGKDVDSATGLHSLLDPDFDLLRQSDEPLLLREHSRKFEYIVSHATLWRRR